MTTYSQGFQSVWLEDIWSMEVAASSIVFHGPGADVSMSFMNPAAAELEFALVKTIWEATKDPYDRLGFIRESMQFLAEGIISNPKLRSAFANKERQSGIDVTDQGMTLVYTIAVAMADKYQDENP